jgi:hypothetical protein
VQPTAENTHNSQALRPAVIWAKGHEETSAAASELVGEVFGTGHDVETLEVPYKI